MEFPWFENSCMVEKNFTGAGMINKVMFKQVQAFRPQGYSKGAIVKALDYRTPSEVYFGTSASMMPTAAGMV
jgi:hypothetical protein